MPSSIQLVRLREREREREEREERERRGTFRAILSEWESRVNTKSVARCLPACLPLFGMTAAVSPAATINKIAFLTLPLTL